MEMVWCMTSQELERIATITDPSGTVGSSFPITAGQFIELDSNAQITPTYTTLTWQWYGE